MEVVLVSYLCGEIMRCKYNNARANNIKMLVAYDLGASYDFFSSLA